MTSNRPYLLRAIYQWIVDNQCKPYVVLDADHPQLQASQAHAKDGRIVLNISPKAVSQLTMTNDALEFDARFGEHVEHIYAPVFSVLAIYEQESGKGLVFDPEDDHGDDGNDHPPTEPPPLTTGNQFIKGKKAHLRVIK